MINNRKKKIIRRNKKYETKRERIERFWIQSRALEEAIYNKNNKYRQDYITWLTQAQAEKKIIDMATYNRDKYLPHYKRYEKNDLIIPKDLKNSIEELFETCTLTLSQKEYIPRIFNTFAKSPSFVDRKKVFDQIVTGYLIIDTLLPLGKGQRALIAGDRQTGKSSIAVDTIINQADNTLLDKLPLYCIYIAIGQKCSSIAYVISTFRKYSCYYFTSVVAATANASAGLQYLAPFTGCALGESYMYTGRNALVIYDDLSKHALAYRQISLLLRKMPGREAYPTDIFWLHAQLLERAAQLNDSNGSGSILEYDSGSIFWQKKTNWKNN